MPTDALHCRLARIRGAPRGFVLVMHLVVGGVLVGGCALTESSPDRQRSEDGVRSVRAGSDSAWPAAAQGPTFHEPRYLRFKPDETQLTAAADDGRFTYLEFAAPLSAEAEFFDQDGRPLAAASAGRVAAIHGVHAGVLVRRAERASFISPNPRALSMPRPSFPETADHTEARAKLENQGGQMQAMQRALAAARLAPAPGPAEARNPSGGTQDIQAMQPQSQQYAGDASQVPRSRQLMQLLRSLKGEAGASSLVPLAAANASASAPERGLVRVFFASASRAIVAPDDGLEVLSREALNADQIRVTGYTDATGSRAANDALALARADAVVQILLRRGIPPERIVSSAVGAEEYIADNATDRGRALNRRAEVLLLRNGVPLAFAPGARATR